MHLSLDGSILGMTSFEELGVEIFEDDDADAFYILDGKTVLVESEPKKDITMRGRCNFTIAHEASHQIFKMLFPQDYGASRNIPAVHFYRTHSEKKKPISDWEEWQANTLAAAILIPQELIEQAYCASNIRQVCSDGGLYGLLKNGIGDPLKAAWDIEEGLS